MCHRCDLVKERQQQMKAAMERVDETFFPKTEPAWAHYDPDDDPTHGGMDPLLDAIAQLTPCEAFLLGSKLHAQLHHDKDAFQKSASWIIAALCAPEECPNP